jgi:hypothetical protein
MISEVDDLFSGIWAGVDDMLEVTVDLLVVPTSGVGVDIVDCVYDLLACGVYDMLVDVFDKDMTSLLHMLLYVSIMYTRTQNGSEK